MNRLDIPLTEFDPDRDAVIEPEKVIRHRDLPEHCILSFFWEVIAKLKDEPNSEALSPIKSEMGEIQLYRINLEKPVGIIPCGVGAPLAAGILEEVIARGGRKFVVCGGSGVLDKTIGSGDVVVVTSALRDEGTSYHYLPPGREVFPSQKMTNAIQTTLDKHNVPYVNGKTWTTDGFYRETRGKIASRKAEGCITVEMEASALFAVGQFRDVEIGQILYGGDDVGGEEWDPRELGKKIPAREKIFWLSVEACLRV
jgi:uridine phosphorylase